MAGDGKRNLMQTAHTTAFARTLARAVLPSDIANDDIFAHHFVEGRDRWLCRVPRLSWWIFARKAPGAAGYFNARTRHFDAVTERELADGLEQLVVLGAGFDTRGIRFADSLGGATVFEVDMAYALDLKRRTLSDVAKGNFEHVRHVAADFESDDLHEKLTARGYRDDARTLFLWEGVTYYLETPDVEAMFAFFQEHSAPGSAVVFDYTTRAFLQGDHGSHGARQLAAAWAKLGDLHRSGIDSASEAVERFGMTLESDLGASELEERYLQSSTGVSVRAWGPMRIAHARRT